MSINGVGAYGSGDLSQFLTKMLSRLDSTKSTTSSTSSSSGTASTGSVSATSEGAASPALTGTSQSALSDQIMALLVQLQQQSTAGGAQAGTAQTTSANDPTQQLFSAMDANGDGTVSQAEMESYIGAKGGTQAEADTLYSALNQTAGGQNGSAGISEQQFAANISQAQPPRHHHHHHHGGPEGGAAGSNSPSDITAQIFGALDTDKDGKVSGDEFSAAFDTGNSASGKSASSSDPSALFSQIDGNTDGSVTTGELGNFVDSLAKQAQSDFNTLGMFGQLAAQSYDTSADLLNKVGAGRSSYA